MTETRFVANQGGFVASLSAELGMPRREVLRFLRAFERIVERTIRDGGEVRLKGFGVFFEQRRKGRAYRHPQTRDLIEVPDTLQLGFRPADRLKRRVDTPKRDGAAAETIDFSGH
ncbi:MAG: HU family DNA-binding protein [Bdellovibrionales bacterium]|nr:HU family DNA-binding protein [Bdellovibrionales bacterium]